MEYDYIKQGDCLELLKEIPDKSIDLIVTDPPYKFENQGGGFSTKNKSTPRSYLESLKNINCCEFNARQFLDMVKPKMKMFYGYFFCNKVLVNEYLNYAKENNYIYDILVMAKSNPIPTHNNHHLSDLEYIIMIREKGSYFSDNAYYDDYRKFYLTNCKKGIHPAEKNVEIIERMIRVSSKESDIIFDPFIGSGTTAIACINTKRHYIGYELDEKYYEIAKKRIV